MSRNVSNEPIHAVAEHGVVLIEGRDGVATALTPAAAMLSAQRMIDAARIAESDPDAESE